MARWPQGALHLPQQLLHQVRRCLSLLQARSMLIKINDKIYSSLSSIEALPIQPAGSSWESDLNNSPPPSWWQQKTTICQYLKWSDHCPATMKHCFWAGSHHPPISLVVWPCCLKPVTTKTQSASQDMYNSVKMKSCPKNSNKPNLYESNPRPVNGPPNLRGFIGLCTIRPKLKIYFVVNAN